MRVVEKAEALALLETYRAGLSLGECLPCELVHSKPEGLNVVAEGEHGIVLLNRFAQRRGHLIVWAKRHVEHVHELDRSGYAGLQSLAYDACVALQQALAPTRVFSAVLGSTTPRPNSYPHLHVHVIPVYERDERARPARVLSWSEGIGVYDDAEAAALTQQLRASWPAPPKVLR